MDSALNKLAKLKAANVRVLWSVKVSRVKQTGCRNAGLAIH